MTVMTFMIPYLSCFVLFHFFLYIPKAIRAMKHKTGMAKTYFAAFFAMLGLSLVLLALSLLADHLIQ